MNELVVLGEYKLFYAKSNEMCLIIRSPTYFPVFSASDSHMFTEKRKCLRAQYFAGDEKLKTAVG